MTERSSRRTALRIATLTVTALAAVQIVIWMLICLISTQWIAPWWAWSAVLPAAALFGVERLADRPRGAGSGPAGADGGEAW
ncbi:MAG: hypothetical protein ACJ73S_09115 [Mycobacteriales bacterium]